MSSRGDRPGASERKRADARRNIEAIVEAGVECLSVDADASVAEIAERAGVGRVTLYGHFPGRVELVEAVLSRCVEDAEAALDGVDMSGDPMEALGRLIGSTWQHVNRLRSVLTAAKASLPPDRIRVHHARPAERIGTLIERGRESGCFRSDLDVTWLTVVVQDVIHAAAVEVETGRLEDGAASDVITATVLAALTPPGAPVPERSTARAR